MRADGRAAASRTSKMFHDPKSRAEEVRVWKVQLRYRKAADGRFGLSVEKEEAAHVVAWSTDPAWHAHHLNRFEGTC